MNRQLIRSYILLVAVAIFLFTVPVAFTLTKQLRDDTRQSVLREANTMALLLSNGTSTSCEALTEVATAYGDVQATPTANCDPELPVPAADAALKRAVEKNESTTDWGTDFVWGRHLTVTVPAKDDAAVRIVYSTSDMTRRLWQIWGFRAALAVLVLAAAAAIGAYAARRITAPLRELNAMASKFGDGDLTARSPVTGPPETQTLARTLNQGAERLDTLVASQRIFVADASHQLRTPLTALRLSLDNIADGVDDEFVREDVEQATAEVVRMSRLVNGLLVLARAEAKVTAAEPLPLREIVDERLTVWRPAADERGVTIALRGSVVDDRPSVLALPRSSRPGAGQRALERPGGLAGRRSDHRRGRVPGGQGGAVGARRGTRHVRRRQVPRLRPLLARSGPDRTLRLGSRPRRRQTAGDRRRRNRGAGGRAGGRSEGGDQPSGIAEEWWLTIFHWPPRFSYSYV